MQIFAWSWWNILYTCSKNTARFIWISLHDAEGLFKLSVYFMRAMHYSIRDNHACRWLISLKGRKRYWILFWAWKVNVFDFRGVTDVRQWWKRFVSLSRSFHPCFTSDNLNFFYFKKKEWNRSIVTDHIKVG